MGWCESPTFFCLGLETTRDLIERMQHIPLPPHKFEHVMMENFSVDSMRPTGDLATLIEVYVNDFIAMNNDTSHEHLQQLSQEMLHGVQAIFPPSVITGHNGYEPIAESKFYKGDGTWEYEKEILGWMVDGLHGTIQLPPKNARISARSCANS